MPQQTNNERENDRDNDPVVSALLNDATAERDGEKELSTDAVFEVLYNRRRRDILRYLRDRDGSATASDLAEHIAAKENDVTVQQLSSSQRKRVYVGLYQNHLPMMDDIGVIEYEKNRGTVRLRECGTQLEPYLDDTVGRDRHRTTVVVAFVLAGMILLGLTGVPPFAAPPELLRIGVGMAGFLGLAALDSYSRAST
ncbi:DUF7344 domain-containing protein [Halopenitus persicus]|uniref:DUF7344 domain-containing protein n=1 Tax=Halopenitus persicus TaxID=1048396 RepID=UPI000BBA8162|nr:helix-turn-helix transcriptional regulator [Halopenitus persicus]